MKRGKLTGIIMAALMAGSWCFGGASADAAVKINPIPNLRQDFIKGADVSMLPELESLGAKFYDVDGTQMDELQIMKNHGVNWIRVRIWNNPEYGIGGGGRTDEARALQLAKRAKELGLKVLVDFHYSDGWADPNQQYTPKVWEKLNKDQLVQTVYDYTKKVVGDFQAIGATPDMIQVGNELKNGMLWPVGRLPSEDNGKAFADLMRSGLKAVRDADPSIKLMVHLPDGADNALFRSFFDQLIVDNGVNDFDIIGLSYYPFWHGSLEQMQANVDDISARYNKDIIVAETAFGFTTENFDELGNHYTEAEEKASGFKATVQGQASGLRAVMDHVNNIPGGHGLGMFYWEPDWIAYPGAGWKDGVGNNWENLAMFDKDGKALESWDVFKDVSDQTLPATKVRVTQVDYMEATSATGIPARLPDKVTVYFSDDHFERMPIVWSDAAPVFDQEGTYPVKGTIQGMRKTVTCNVEIAKGANLLKNGDFEIGLDDWNITGSAWITPASGEGNAIGSGSLKYWNAGAFDFVVSQDVENLTDGRYTVEVTTQGKGDSSSYNLFVIGDNGAKRTAALKDSGWAKWSTVRITDVEIKNGKATVGIEMKAKPDNWGTVDNIRFYRQE